MILKEIFKKREVKGREKNLRRKNTEKGREKEEAKAEK
jgi:hypothetical protein